ncbi:MAG: zinc ABC transporter substrate-binding protein [Actinobacteria bacterium]|nr:zinc ABC transporter substrate-binding protein [Actinomycetota bacterium]
MKRSLLALAALVLLAAGCGTDGDDPAASQEPKIIAAFYPLEFVAAEIAGGNAGVTNLSPPGVEPHDLELAPDQIRSLAQADLVLYIGEGFQPAVEDVVGELSGTAVIDGLEAQDELIEGGDPHEDEEGHEDELEEGATDPHVWLDPTRVASLGHAVAAEMERIDPDNADVYEDSAVALTDALAGLDEEYSAALENCEDNELVVSHEAFGYLTERYGLEQVGVSGIDPESEPSPGRMAEVAEFAREHEVTTIFFEEQVAPDIAQVIADEVGAGVEVLDPLEFPPDGGSDYFDVMRTNLDSISSALGCE